MNKKTKPHLIVGMVQLILNILLFLRIDSRSESITQAFWTFLPTLVLSFYLTWGVYLLIWRKGLKALSPKNFLPNFIINPDSSIEETNSNKEFKLLKLQGRKKKV